MIKFNKSELSNFEQKMSEALVTLKNKDASNYKQVQAAKLILKNEGLISRSNVLLARKVLQLELETPVLQTVKAEAVLSDLLSTEQKQQNIPISYSNSDFVKRK